VSLGFAQLNDQVFPLVIGLSCEHIEREIEKTLEDNSLGDQHTRSGMNHATPHLDRRRSSTLESVCRSVTGAAENSHSADMIVNGGRVIDRP
jgi:hypothetical protein